MFTVDEFEPDLNRLTEQHNSWLGAAVYQTQALPEVQAPALNANALKDSSGGAARAGEAELIPDLSPANYELGASFLVFSLDADVVQTKQWVGRDLSELVKPTLRRHHQLKLNGQAVAYSRTLIDNDELCQLWVTEIAAAIEDAIEWVEEFENKYPEYAAANPLVRLLRVPPYGVYAFWIQKQGQESDVLVIWPKDSDTLPRERLLNSEEFLSGLESAVPMAGLTGPRVNLNDLPQT